MTDLGNWHISGIFCCANTKDPKEEIKRQKVDAILELVLGDFRVGFIAYHENF